MGVYRAKNGDVMGSYAWSRPNREQRKEWAIKKQQEEEKQLNEDYYKVKRVALKYEQTVRAQRKAAGLE
jgi:hypothetical protein